MNKESVDESAVRTALQDVVPPLREPANRIAEIGARVRRHRARRATTAAALTITAMLAGTGALQPMSPPDPGPKTNVADDCPPAGVPLPSRVADVPGAIVPEGAIRVTLCARVNPKFALPDDADYAPRLLTQEVGELVSWANGLTVSGSEPRMCFAVGYTRDMSFVFGYPDRPPLTMWVDRSCGALVTTDHVRYFGYEEALDTFYRLYRAQLRSTTPVSTIRTPECPATHDPRIDTSRTSPKDGIGANRGFAAPLLPDPPAALAACRYRLAGDTWILVRQEQRRTDLEVARSAANDTFAVRDYAECMSTVKDAMRPTLFDSLWVADTTGAVSEVRVWRRPCAVFLTADSVVLPRQAILRYLDSVLGEPT